jgi:hypothetical protein
MRARFLIWCLALQAVSCVGTGGGTPNDDLLRSCRMDRSAGGPWAPWARDVWKGRYPPKLPCHDRPAWRVSALLLMYGAIQARLSDVQPDSERLRVGAQQFDVTASAPPTPIRRLHQTSADMPADPRRRRRSTRSPFRLAGLCCRFRCPAPPAGSRSSRAHYDVPRRLRARHDPTQVAPEMPTGPLAGTTSPSFSTRGRSASSRAPRRPERRARLRMRYNSPPTSPPPCSTHRVDRPRGRGRYKIVYKTWREFDEK